MVALPPSSYVLHGQRLNQISLDLAKRPLILGLLSARALRDSYRICFPNLRQQSQEETQERSWS
jgi:hypothetical protein